MQKTVLGRALAFVALSVVSGLALAFLIVAWRPQLLERAAPLAAAIRADRGAHEARSASAGGSGPVSQVSFAAAVERAAPAVVNVFTARVVTERIPPSGLGQLFGGFDLPRYRQRIERSLGSGVILDSEGHIVTNEHVIANAAAIRVQLADGRTADATLVGRDPDTDLAVLKIALKHLPVMPMGRSDQLRVGDVVLAIGDPLGLSQSVTHGIVSATGRQQLGVAPLEDFIQTDAPINVGNSGGALVDTRGELVGINTAIAAKNLGAEGIGFAIPVNLVRGVVKELISKGRVIRGWIGIVPEDVPGDEAAQLGLAHGGVVVATLYLGSPAVQSGLRPGDLITKLDGAPVTSAQEVLAHIAGLAPGNIVRISGLRGTTPFEVRIPAIERPQNR
ncbi:MAG: S1C family serine protease [Steroidobacteraceae bacterium]